MPRELFNPLTRQVRSYAVDEKTAHRAAKFCDYWRGSDRVGETLSSFGRYYQAFLVTSPYRCKKDFVNKLNLLKRSSFSSRNALLDLYFKIMLPSVLYRLVVWGGCPNADLLHSLEVLHRRAARIIYKLPQDMPTEEVY